MSRIKYEIFGNVGELAEYERDAGDIIFMFEGVEATHLSVFGHSFEVRGSSVTVPKERITDGVHIPRLLTREGQVLLPLIETDGNKIAFPEKEGACHRLSLRLARLNEKVTSLEKSLSELEGYVKGSVSF